ncbi:MAG: SpoIIE family protein phosphatase [Candidatus Solibacter usitatus]|nr:SpoIIE family protein phosphatase [Candidatus Solibacter usitatus]
MRLTTLLLLAACSALAQSQALYLDISGEWKLQTGDSPEYAKPGFDDRSWKTVRLPRAGVEQPLGYWWLRRTVDVPSWVDDSQLAITLGGMNEVYELFVNGTRIGSVGSPPLSKTHVARARTFDIPPGIAPAGARITVAMRHWYSGYFTAENRDVVHFPDSGPYLLTYRGNAPRDAAAASLARRERYAIPTLAASVIEMILALLLLMVWMIQRERKDLISFAAWLVAEAWVGLFGYTTLVCDWPHLAFWSGIGLTSTVSLPLLTLFATQTLRRPLRILLALSCLQSLVFFGFLCWYVLLDLQGGFKARVAQYSVWEIDVILPAALLAVAGQALWTAIRRRNWREAVMPAGIAVIVFLIGQRITWLFKIVEGGFVFNGMNWEMLPLLTVVAGFAMTAQLIFNAGAERHRLAGEMEAARAVQQLLLSSEQTGVNAWAIETEYHPAQEVGGDFYQAFPLDNGDLLLVVGDVSGKGLKAAMVVSIMVGALRSHRDKSPAQLLGEMNRALAVGPRSGFVTCIAARFQPDGTVTLSNAGHLAPYSAGREVATTNDLPLGILDGTEYSEMQMHIDVGNSLVLMTDGIVEAATSKGELFGFERTLEISSKPVERIAAVAKAWGQNDDITVVSVRRM